jgi:hypothetical protein
MDWTTDLFGDERPVKGAAPVVHANTLFDLAAEQAALESGLPVSQERTRLTHGDGSSIEDGLL